MANKPAVEKKMTFAEFFKGRDVSNLTKEVTIKRIPIPFVIKALSKETFSEISRQAGKDGQKMMEGLIIEGTIEPNFRSASFLEQLGVTNPKDALNKIFLPGEFFELAEEVGKLSEFDFDINEKVEQAKN